VIVHKHVDHALFKIVCVCLLCFMFASCALMEERECGCFVSLDLEDGFASCVVLIFVLHDVLWD